jgi:hypothetical protein
LYQITWVGDLKGYFYQMEHQKGVAADTLALAATVVGVVVVAEVEAAVEDTLETPSVSWVA